MKDAAEIALRRPTPCVLIIGGGIGGLCLAQGLKKAGIDFRVFERDASPEARLQGYRLNIEPIGARALKACLPRDLWETLIADAGDAGRGMGVFDEQMALLMRETVAAPSDPADDTHAVSRRKLRQLLLVGLEQNVSFNKSYSSYERAADGKIRALFEDGSSAEGDLLVGADGVNSRVRSQFLPDAKIRRAGGVGIGGRLPLTPETEAWVPSGLLTGKSMILPKRDFLFTAAYRNRRRAAPTAAGDEGDYLMWAFVTGTRGMRTGGKPSGENLRDRILDRLVGWAPELCRLVAETPAGSIERFDFRAARPVRRWQSGPITLLGDAIHVMPPVGGMGGNAALADASSLLEALVDASAGKRPPAEALALYERQMLKRGFATVRQSQLYLQLAIFPFSPVRAAARAFFRACGASPFLKQLVFGPTA